MKARDGVGMHTRESMCVAERHATLAEIGDEPGRAKPECATLSYYVVLKKQPSALSADRIGRVVAVRAHPAHRLCISALRSEFTVQRECTVLPAAPLKLPPISLRCFSQEMPACILSLRERLASLRLPIGPYARCRSLVTALPPPRLTRPRGQRALAEKGPPSQQAASSHWCRRRGGARRRQGTRRGAPWPTGLGCPYTTRTRSVSSPRP